CGGLRGGNRSGPRAGRAHFWSFAEHKANLASCDSGTRRGRSDGGKSASIEKGNAVRPSARLTRRIGSPKSAPLLRNPKNVLAYSLAIAVREPRQARAGGHCRRQRRGRLRCTAESES